MGLPEQIFLTLLLLFLFILPGIAMFLEMQGQRKLSDHLAGISVIGMGATFIGFALYGIWS